MTERRETGRTDRKPSGARPNTQKNTQKKAAPAPKTDAEWSEGGERIAKYLARAGIASRREIERPRNIEVSAEPGRVDVERDISAVHFTA